MLKEQWKDIEGWEGKYCVSNFGRIFSVRKNILKVPDMNNAGYLRIQFADKRDGKLIRERYFVHRLVAHYFVDGEDRGLVVNHKDGNKLNNYADNLEWVTQKENAIHAQKNELLDKTVQFKDKPYCIETEDGFKICFKNMTELSRSVGISKGGCYNYLKAGGKIPKTDLTIVPAMPRDYPRRGVGRALYVRNGAVNKRSQDIVRHPQECGTTESMGYHRPREMFNAGKQSEFKERVSFEESKVIESPCFKNA